MNSPDDLEEERRWAAYLAQDELGGQPRSLWGGIELFEWLALLGVAMTFALFMAGMFFVGRWMAGRG